MGKPSQPFSVIRATMIGVTAVLMWATLALLTTLSGSVPPFQLAAMAFTVAFMVSIAFWRVRGVEIGRLLRHPPAVWIVGVGGLFGYHFFYFMALRNAPPIQAGLIAYLWPLLIVLFSSLLPGERLRWWHTAGAACGLGGTIVLVTGGDIGGIGFAPEYIFGYAMALGGAVTWATYSVLSRRFAHVPSDVVGVFCGVSALLAMISHLMFETTVWPGNAVEWLAIAMLGLGPVGAAFFTWDIGMKQGDIRVLGAISYGAPLLSTGLLVAFGFGEGTTAIAVAALMITGGAVLASIDMLKAKKSG